MPDKDRQFQLLVNILKSGILSKSPDRPGIEPNMMFSPNDPICCAQEMFRPSVVCFSDTPPGDFGIHIEKYGEFGLAFSKKFLVARGATPVFYVENNASFTSALDEQIQLGEKFNQMATRLLFLLDPCRVPHPDWDASGFLIYHILAYVKCFDSQLPDDHPHNFYMEREWRVIGRVQFLVPDVSRVIIPTEYSGRLREHVPESCGQVSFSTET